MAGNSAVQNELYKVEKWSPCYPKNSTEALLLETTLCKANVSGLRKNKTGNEPPIGTDEV